MHRNRSENDSAPESGSPSAAAENPSTDPAKRTTERLGSFREFDCGGFVAPVPFLTDKKRPR